MPEPKEKKKTKSHLHFRKYVLRGFVATIPLGITIMVVILIYNLIDRKAMELVDQYIGYKIPGLGVISIIVFFYIIGIITSNVIGKKIFSILDHISEKIPIIKTVYQIGKQLSSTLSLPEKQVFKKVVFVDLIDRKSYIIGFITGTVTDSKTKEVLYKVFLPTVPNPTTGFVTFVKESQIKDPNWTIEEGMKTVISGGIIGPDIIDHAKAINKNSFFEEEIS